MMRWRASAPSHSRRAQRLGRARPREPVRSGSPSRCHPVPARGAAGGSPRERWGEGGGVAVRGRGHQDWSRASPPAVPCVRWQRLYLSYVPSRSAVSRPP
eukprot:2736478-Pleurochrysis_carterae.AAC.1